ncbi:MAG: hypothetical protein NW206_19580 [Hyphomonadaceae bacterium]|nr:hypothetical protein [Hyphomonadaceae bacterium]
MTMMEQGRSSRAGGAKPAKRDQRAEARAANAAAVELCQQVLADCAMVVKAFSHVSIEDILKRTRGQQEHSFPRQLLMAGLVSELGFKPTVVGAAIGRDPSTVEHACVVIEAIRGGLGAIDLIEALGEDGVREYLGGAKVVCAYETLPKKPGDKEPRRKVVAILSGGEAVEEFIETAEGLVDAMFAAFELVAVRGAAYRREVARMKAEREDRERELARWRE